MEQVVLGIALIIMAFQKNVEKVKIAAWVIIALLSVRWLVITVVTVLFGISNVMNFLTSSIAFFVLIVLLLLGVRVKNK